MNLMIRMLNFVLGIVAVMLVLLGATTPEEQGSKMLIFGVCLFILTFTIHLISQMMVKASR